LTLWFQNLDALLKKLEAIGLRLPSNYLKFQLNQSKSIFGILFAFTNKDLRFLIFNALLPDSYAEPKFEGEKNEKNMLFYFSNGINPFLLEQLSGD
jgi:hypothetical protein